jgi:hypothetical protein
MDRISWNSVLDTLRNGEDTPFAKALIQAVSRHPRIRGKPAAELLRNYGVESKDIVQELAVKILKDQALMQARLYSLPDYVLGERVNRDLENLLIDKARSWRGRKGLYDDASQRAPEGASRHEETSGVEELVGSYVLSTSRSTEDDYVAKLTRDRAIACLTDRQRLVFEKYEGFGGDMTVLELTRFFGVKKSSIYEEIRKVKQRLAKLVEEES